MRIGIDLRMDHSGIGRYSLRLAEELVGLGGDEEYVLIARAGRYAELRRLEDRAERLLADIRWYTLSEQVSLPAILRAARLDLVHFTNFNVPVAYRGPYVVTVHDLIHGLRKDLHTRAGGSDPAARPWKALPYRFVLGRAVRRADRVIAVSEATKREIVARLGIDPDRVAVTYEGIDDALRSVRPEPHPSVSGTPYFLTVGNAYPHKNLPRLLEALSGLTESLAGFRLVLAGDHGPTGAGLTDQARTLGIESRVVFPGQVTDAQLAGLYRGATALAIVSLAEGFGLPGLEAMALGVPVLASRIDALTEIYGDAALYVSPTDPADIARGLAELASDPGLRTGLIRRGTERAARFSWRATAEATRRIYLERGGDGKRG